MIYTTHYKSPVGEILLAGKDNKLIGLWIKSQKYYPSTFNDEIQENNNYKILKKTKSWLDRYFNNEKPNIDEIELELIGSEFRKEVWEILIKIPYGKTITYNDIATKIAKRRGIRKMSAQAVGGAIGHNPISIIIPCHRVVGANRSLVGYSGGVDVKYELLRIEGNNMNDFKM